MTRVLSETWLLAERSLRQIPRAPQRLSDVTIQPVIFILLFAYVFGSAIQIGAGSYHAYLLSGMMAVGMTNTLGGLAVGIANDVNTGFMDRLRVLPISRLSVLAGRAVAEFVQNILGLVVVIICGLAIGWAPHGTVLETVSAIGIMFLWGFVVTWPGILCGLIISDAESAQALTFLLIIPLMFLSAVFVPVDGLPTPLRQIAEWNPLSCLATATRQLFHNPLPDLPHAWPLQHPVLASIIWCVAIIAIFAPISVRRFQSITQG